MLLFDCSAIYIRFLIPLKRLLFARVSMRNQQFFQLSSSHAAQSRRKIPSKAICIFFSLKCRLCVIFSRIALSLVVKGHFKCDVIFVRVITESDLKPLEKSTTRTLKNLWFYWYKNSKKSHHFVYKRINMQPIMNKNNKPLRSCSLIYVC